MFGFFESKEKRGQVQITVSNRTVIRILLLVLLAEVTFAAVRHAQHAIIILFTAFFLALALNGPVQWLAQRIPGKRRGSRSIATAISFFIVVAALVGFISSLVPPLVRQTSTFIDAAPHLVQQVRNEDSGIGRIVRRYKLSDEVNNLSTQISNRLKNGTGTAVSTVSKVGSSLFTMLTVLALTFMMLIEGPRWIKLFEEIVPKHHRAHASTLARDMYRVVKGYVNGQVTLAVIAASLVFPALLVLHISYPIALMVIVFICGLIPMVGHTIGAIIVTIVALFHSVPSAIIILAYYILYQQIENYIIQPRIQANSTNMSPLLVFTSVVIGVNFGGLFGGLVAIPVAGCIRIAVLDYLVNRGIIEYQEEEQLEGQSPTAASTH
jgi:predicted PurR-regulated permease PerM